MGHVSVQEVKRRKIFNLINFAFWGIWLIVPFYIAASTYYWNEAIIFSGIEDACSSVAAPELSFNGKIATNMFFVFDTLIYLILFGLMHVLVNDCAKDRFLVNRSVSIMGYIAAVVILWPIFTLITFNLTKYYLFSIGDINQFNPEYQIDVIMIGAGFFFIVLRFILVHAFKLQEEAKLIV
jgi:hypothetical protein